MPKTKLKTKSKAIIQKEKVNFGRKNKKSNSISKGSFLNSKIKKMEIQLPNFSSIRSRNKSLLNNKRFRSRGKSNEKSEKIIEKNKKVRNNYLNKSTKKNNIKINKQNEKLNSNFLNKKRKKKKLNYKELQKEDKEEKKVYSEDEEEEEKDEESIKSFSEARLEYLPCRKDEQDKIYNYIKKGLQTNGNYSSLYIAGMPGTGKTASVKTIINILESELNEAKKKNEKTIDGNDIIPFRTLFLSGINYPNLSNVFKVIYKFIFTKAKDKMNIKSYIHVLNNFFAHRKKYNRNKTLVDPTNSHILLIIDELDILINTSQNLLYNIFNWTTYDY